MAEVLVRRWLQLVPGRFGLAVENHEPLVLRSSADTELSGIHSAMAVRKRNREPEVQRELASYSKDQARVGRGAWAACLIDSASERTWVRGRVRHFVVVVAAAAAAAVAALAEVLWGSRSCLHRFSETEDFVEGS